MKKKQQLIVPGETKVYRKSWIAFVPRKMSRRSRKSQISKLLQFCKKKKISTFDIKWGEQFAPIFKMSDVPTGCYVRSSLQHTQHDIVCCIVTNRSVVLMAACTAGCFCLEVFTQGHINCVLSASGDSCNTQLGNMCRVVPIARKKIKCLQMIYFFCPIQSPPSIHQHQSR